MNYIDNLTVEQRENTSRIVIDGYALKVVDYLGEVISKAEFKTVEVLLESPPNIEGLYRIAACSVVNERGETIHIDETVKDNSEFFSEGEAQTWLSKHYKISEDDIVIDFEV